MFFYPELLEQLYTRSGQDAIFLCEDTATELEEDKVSWSEFLRWPSLVWKDFLESCVLFSLNNKSIFIIYFLKSSILFYKSNQSVLIDWIRESKPSIKDESLEFETFWVLFWSLEKPKNFLWILKDSIYHISEHKFINPCNQLNEFERWSFFYYTNFKLTNNDSKQQ